jgi:4-nitrophenyl phosphatase
MRELAQLYDYFLFDCDGVLWYSDKQIGQAIKNIDYLESLGKKVFIVTNTSSQSRKSLCRKLISDNFGYQNAKIDHLYPGSTLCALYLKHNMPEVNKVWCLGMPNLIEELNSHDIECIGGTSGLP